MPLDDAPFMLPPVRAPESAMVPGMAAPQPPGTPPSVNLRSMADTSLSLGVAVQEPVRWTYDFDAAGNARATFPGQAILVSGLGALTIGQAPQNTLTFRPGASAGVAASIATSGNGGLQLATAAVGIGAPPQNALIVTPGAAGANPVTIAGTGAGGITLAANVAVTGGGGLTVNAAMTVGGSLTTTGAVMTVGGATNNALQILPGNAPGNDIILFSTGTGNLNMGINTIFQSVGFNGSTPLGKPTVTGSRGGNAALASLLTALKNTGLLTDNSVA